MEGCTQSGKLLCLLLAVFLGGPVGCYRKWYRSAADKEVAAVLGHKDKYPQWHIEQYHVYPDPRSRFADPTNPDRPPMPPDDPATYDLSPNPQKPGKPGIAKVEGVGYVELLAMWDKENRAQKALEDAQRKNSTDNEGDKSNEGVKQASFQVAQGTIGSREEIANEYGRGGTDPLATSNGTSEGKQNFLLKLEQAVELGLVNSRDFQTRREDLYLAALPVTLERYAFAAQWLAVSEFTREYLGKYIADNAPDDSNNRWAIKSGFGVGKLFSTGALLLVAFANKTFIELTGPEKHTISQSTMSLDLVQPLLQGGGKAVTLEPLTQVERNLLYEIRDYARFRKEFFVAVAGGAAGGSGSINVPTSFGLIGVGSSGRLTIGAGVNTTTQTVQSSQLAPGQGGSTQVGSAGLVAPNQGFLPTLLAGAILRNERANVAALENILKFFEAFKEGGDISPLQVGQVEQQLLSSRSTVLQRELDYRTALDNFKLQLGLPTDLCLEIDDCPLRPINDHLQRYEDLSKQFTAARDQAASYGGPAEVRQLRGRLLQLFTSSPVVRDTQFRSRIRERWEAWQRLNPVEVTTRREDFYERRRKLLDLKTERDQQGQALAAEDQRRLDDVEFEIDLEDFESTLRRYEAQPWLNQPDLDLRQLQRDNLFRDVIGRFGLVLEEARRERLEKLRGEWPSLPRICLEGCDLLEGELDAAMAKASQTALINRFDIMNARAQLVDAWRKIAVIANSLLGVFNVRYHMESATPPNEAQPLAFQGGWTRHQLHLNVEAPLVRKAERNNYRATLIAYQRQRRALMSFEDQVLFDLRSEIRQLRVLAENYKIQQRSVELAYLQVDNSFEVFRQPPQPGTQGQAAAGSAAALTQQLLGAQGSLPRAQNGVYTVWVNYLTTRLQLYRDLELMPLDPRGVWIDDVANKECGLSSPSGSASSSQRSPDGSSPGPEKLPEPRQLPEPSGPELPQPGQQPGGK